MITDIAHGLAWVWHHIPWHDVWYFLGVTLFFNKIVLGWLADKLRSALFKLYVKTEHDLMLWWHVQHAHGQQHPQHCAKGLCGKLKHI